jgi:integrase
MRGDGRIYQRGNVFWIAYYLRGEKFREPARDKDNRPINDAKAAEKFLRARMKEVAADQIGARSFETPQARRLTVGDLLDGLESDYQLRGKASPQALSYIEQVRKDWGDKLAASITPGKIDAYISEKLAADYRPASINRRLQIIGAAFNLAIRRGTLARGPYVRKLSEVGNARQGFFSEAELAAVLEHLPADLHDFVRFAAATGMRKSEIASLTWADIEGDVLTLKGENSKNGEARNIPLIGELAQIIARRKSARGIVRDGVATTELCDFIFHRNGSPVRAFRKSWATATKLACSSMIKAGVKQEDAQKVSGKLFHDLRRFAVRSMTHAGVPQAVAMKVSGHKTASMFARYNIVDTGDVRHALEQTEQFRKAVSS